MADNLLDNAGADVAMKTLYRWLALGCMLLCGMAQAAETNASNVTVAIDAQPMESALNAFAHQTGLQLLFHVEEVITPGLNAPRVNGTLPASEALEQLLAESGLRYEFINEKTVAIGLVKARSSKAGAESFSGSNQGIQLVQGEAASPSEMGDQREGEKRSADTSVSSEAEKSKGIQEIVVTAQKRKESLQDVPISISVLGGEELDASSLSDVRDALNSVPSMDFTQSGSTNSKMISLRGVANGKAIEGGASTVAYYLDGTPFGFVRQASVPLDADIYDLERIEVLRGPQGTLYGASSLNGVIRVLTHDASTKAFELRGRTFLSSTEEGGSNYGGNLAVNVPLIQDKLAVRAVLGYRHDSGWIESPIDNNVNSSKLQSYRLKVRAEPTETLTIDLSAWRSKGNGGATSQANDDNRITSLQDQPSTTEYDVFGAEIIKYFGAFSVSSMTSYIDARLFGRFDGTPSGANLALETEFTSKIFTEELNIVSQHGGPWRWSVGAFYRDAKDGNFTLRDWFPPSEAIRGDTEIQNNYRDTSKSVAVYGELGRRFLNDKLELSAGLRYFHDKQTLQILSPYLATLPLTPIPSSAEAVTPRVVLTWSPTSINTFYASYSQGFRSGVSQAPNVQAQAPQFPAARPDKLHNYEVGTKGSLLNGRLTYEGAVYYIDWQNVQQPVRVDVIPGSLISTALVNSGSASGLGAEFSLSVRPTDGLELGPYFSWNDLAFDSAVVEADGRVLFPKGGRLVVSPEYTAGAFARYSFPLGGDGLTGALAISGGYKSAQTWYFLSPPGPARVYVPTLGDTRFDGGSAKFSITARDRWTARLFVDNITNEYSSPAPIGLGGNPGDTEWRERPRPRTVGLQLEYDFK